MEGARGITGLLSSMELKDMRSLNPNTTLMQTIERADLSTAGAWSIMQNAKGLRLDQIF